MVLSTNQTDNRSICKTNIRVGTVSSLFRTLSHDQSVELNWCKKISVCGLCIYLINIGNIDVHKLTNTKCEVDFVDNKQRTIIDFTYYDILHD